MKTLLLSLLIIPNLLQAPQFYHASPDPLDDVIEHLSWCESRHNPLAYNKADPVTASYGRFQYKWDTFVWFGDKYDLFPDDIEEAEIENLIWDGDFQEKMTRKALEDGRWKMWFNCLRGHYQENR